MAQPLRQRVPATYEDLSKVPDHFVAEIIDGELVATPRPSPRHAAASSGLAGALHGPFDRGRGGPGGWQVLFEPELHLANDIVVPDLAGWRRERLPALPDEAFFWLAPDWVCVRCWRPRRLRWTGSRSWRSTPVKVWEACGSSTLSPRRSRFCARPVTWVLVTTAGGGSTVSAEPFDALALDLTLLWDVPPLAQS